MFNGLNTALITPFKDGRLDEKALERLIEFQIDANSDSVVVCGTTGESPTVSNDEHRKIIELSVKYARKKIKVIAGTGSNCTKEAVDMTIFARDLGADGCLIVAPYYNKPNFTGIYRHFEELNKIDIPLIVYNIPGRSVIDISDDNLAKLAELKNVVAVKDATGDLARVVNLKSKTPKDFCILSGEDATIVGFNAMGGDGVISVTSNIAPKIYKELLNAIESSDLNKAQQLQQKLLNLNDVMFCETNPIPVKYAASLMGLCQEEIKLPLVEPSDAAKDKIKQALKDLSLI